MKGQKLFKTTFILRKEDFKDLRHYHLDMWKELKESLGIEAYTLVDEINVNIEVISMTRIDGKTITI